MSLTVELVYDKDCPHVAATRANLLRAFEAAGVPAMWTEWEQSSPEAPGHLPASDHPPYWSREATWRAPSRSRGSRAAGCTREKMAEAVCRRSG